MHHWNPIAISHLRIDRNARIRARDFLHWPFYITDTAVVFTHELFVNPTPSGQVGGKRTFPENDGQQNIIVSKHPSADDPVIVMIKLTGSNSCARPEAVVNVFLEKPH